MVFSDLLFLFVFLPAVAVCYLSFRQARNTVLVLFSLLFYAWGEPVYVLLMLACVAVNHRLGLCIDKAEDSSRKRWLAVGVTFNVAILALFKYAGIWSLPIGISFYTFQSISYLVDVYRRQSPVQPKYKDLLLYISMFPQLIAGPIVRYDTVAREINERHVSADDLSEGMLRFVRGLGKKVIFANQFSEITTQLFTGVGFEQMTTPDAWLGLVAFALQIYFDFSGYSDMAIGIGRCLGFHFCENFNHPYCCTSITDFWRRWHMSLGSFFRDYVYIPLGGNRRHQIINILVVWMLTGYWHGATLNFLLWGLYFGIIIMLEKYTLLKVIHRIPRIFLSLYSLLIVTLGWGLFYFDDFAKLSHVNKVLFGQGELPADYFQVLSLLQDRFWLWIVAILLCMPIRKYIERWAWVRAVVAAVLLIASVALLVGATNNAFLYTRF